VWQRAAPRPGRAGNLPWPTTTFVDRPELPQALGVLDNPSSRLVTLVGPHGSGKTRLALAAAEAVAGAFADGIWFVDLAEGDSQDIAGLIAAALSVRPAVTTGRHWPTLSATGTRCSCSTVSMLPWPQDRCWSGCWRRRRD
jgi:ATP/maltotriose-dependent transcriptional regulator MalT